MSKKNKDILRVVELFAGVGGFRLGLEGYNGKSPLSGYKRAMKNDFKVIWSNQWEPSTKRQHANEVYNARWEHSIEIIMVRTYWMLSKRFLSMMC